MTYERTFTALCALEVWWLPDRGAGCGAYLALAFPHSTIEGKRCEREVGTAH